MNSEEKVSSFNELNLHPDILRAVAEAGYTVPTPIQSQVIPHIVAGADLQASAQTGTGKTAAFLLPALQRLTVPSDVKANGPRILILVPTRELAMQVSEEAMKYSRFLPRTKTVCVYGGMPYPVQNRALSRPYEILVATPGRLIDHLERGRIDLSRVEIFILDEADRMLDMGFIEPVEEIAAQVPENHQTLLFSATLKGNVLNLSKRLLKNPIEISVAAKHTKHENIEQRLHHVDNIGHKQRLLEHLLEDPTISQAIIFTSTKLSADQLVDTLYENGHNAAALHGDMNQRQRTRTINQLRLGQIRVLVATDVAARGIDVSTITHVINFDLPNNAEDYVHRIGRTGRAGAKGIAFSFAASRDFQLVKRIEQYTGQKIELHSIPGFEAKSKFVAGASPRGGSSKKGYQDRNSHSHGQGERRFSRQPSSDRPNRQFSNDRPNRQGFNDRPPRQEFNDRPPRQEFNDRPPRQAFNDRPPRQDQGDRPFGRQGFNDKPNRQDQNDRPFKRQGFSDRKTEDKPGSRFGSKPAGRYGSAKPAAARFDRSRPSARKASTQSY